MATMVHCRLCNHFVSLEEFDKHYRKCSSINYIQTKLKQLYNQDIKYSDLYNLSEVEFNKKYFWVMNRAYENTNNDMEKKVLENILYGTNYELKDIM